MANAQQSGLACVGFVSADDFKLKLALAQSRPLFSSPSVAFTLAERRLKEDHRPRSTRGLFSDEQGFAFQSTFAGCVRQQD